MTEMVVPLFPVAEDTGFVTNYTADNSWRVC